ncbi:HalOD1 output domain-containing protein [Haladaptatus pallidirubidus]|uniref:Halobacterial output domain-containing protein n=1 Tax=Haladaptatus pallidirubidus TaxID=1008152 RepID=A0AAV3UQH1_9EURY|nr:HalOD1 output domain-containing protein [Haladaptatus pallidirubidus]
MASEPMTTQTTSWFGSTTEQSGPRSPPQYALVASETIDLESSSSELITSVVEALIDVIEPAGGQTTLSLYEYVDPDALENIIEASASKQSDVEVRFTIEDYLVTVRSDYTILIHESLGAHSDASEKFRHK